MLISTYMSMTQAGVFGVVPISGGIARKIKEEDAMQIQPYLFFDGRCDEALDFYKKTLGAKIEMVMRFKDAPDQSMISPGSADKVMHASVKIGDSTVLASDGHNTGKPNFQGFSLTLYPR